MSINIEVRPKITLFFKCKSLAIGSSTSLLIIVFSSFNFYFSYISFYYECFYSIILEKEFLVVSRCSIGDIMVERRNIVFLLLFEISKFVHNIYFFFRKSLQNEILLYKHVNDFMKLFFK